MQISIAIPSLNFCGGAEAVTLSLIKLLKGKGYDVKLITADKPDWKKIERILGYSVEVSHIYKLNQDITNNLSAINMLKLILSYRDILNKNKILINMYGDLDIFMNKGDITYINGIPFSIIDKDKAPLYLKGIKHSIYTLFTNYKIKNILISNSFYTKEIIKDRLGLESFVIHPPPTIDKILNTAKEDIVLTITRIARGKKVERVLNMAEMLSDIKFVIIGRMYDNMYYEELLYKSKRMNIKNLTFLINKPRNVMLDYLSRAKILLHTMDHETYGLSIIEGMLAKCIPIVPRNGGPWIDILDKRDGLYGYSYDSIDTAKDIIKMIINSNNSIANNAYERALLLSKEFYTEFPRVIEHFTHQ